MDIHQLRVFVSVFKERSFSRASSAINLTQPTISDHIRILEEELACKLFDRLGRTILPTKEADVLYGYALEVLEKIEALKDAFSRMKKEIAGELVIGASTIPGTYILPHRLAAFRKKYPSITFRISISDSKGITEQVLRNELLMGIVGATDNSAQLNFIPFMEEELVAVASPSLFKKSSISFDDLIASPMVFREEGSGTRKEVEKNLERKGISPDALKISGFFGSTDAIKQAVKEGLGISILSRLAVADELKYHTLKLLHVAGFQIKRKFHIVTHKKRSLPPAYNIFLEYLQKN